VTARYGLSIIDPSQMSSRYGGSGDGPERIARGGLDAATLLVLLVAAWLVTRPYIGIIGDAKFYAVAGLAKLSPAAFTGDLFLAGGNNAPGSIYLLLYTPVVARLGLQASNFLLLLIGGALWAGGAYSVAATMLRSRSAVIWAFVLTLALPSDLSFIAAGEPLVTPRLFAEALSLYGIGFVLRGRLLLALGFVGTAFLLHPLMALPTIALIVVYLGHERPALFGWALLPAAAVLMLVFANVWPFSLGRETFDEAWLAELQIREYSVFLQNWTIVAWLPVLDTLFLTCICLLLAAPQQRRLIWSALALSIAGFATALVGGDLLHNVLIFDLQLWRSGWLLIIVTHVCTAEALCVASTRMSIRLKYLIAVAVALCVLSRFLLPLLLLSVPAMATAAVALILSRVTKGRMKALGLVFIYAYTVLLAYFVFVALNIWLNQMQSLANIVRQSLIDTAILVSTLGAIVIIQRLQVKDRARLITSGSLFFAALIILGLAISQWDHRSKWTKFVEDASAAPASLTNILPARLPIYWDGDVTVPWFLLRRASYFSCDQGAAILFSRASAVLFAERYRSFAALDSVDYRQGPYCPSASSDSAAIDSFDRPQQKLHAKSEGGSEVAAICSREPGLGAIVLTKRLTETPSAIWNSPVPFKFISSRFPVIERSETNNFYIYDCKRGSK
jgi:hypothetical protein